MMWVFCIWDLHLPFFFFFRDNGLKAIENLMEKKGKFDYILLETTGLADPGTISARVGIGEKMMW